MPDNTERFTQRARHVLSLTQEEAERLKCRFIGPEHLLLGMMREDGGVANRVLKEFGLDEHRVSETVESLPQSGPRKWREPLNISPKLKLVLDLAVVECRRMENDFVGTEHLLLGLVNQADSLAIEVLKRLSVSPVEIRQKTLQIVQPPAEPT